MTDADALTPEREAQMRHWSRTAGGDWPDDLGVLLAEVDRLRAALAGGAAAALLAMDDDAFVDTIGEIAALRCIHCGVRTGPGCVCYCMNDE